VPAGFQEEKFAVWMDDLPMQQSHRARALADSPCQPQMSVLDQKRQVSK